MSKLKPVVVVLIVSFLAAIAWASDEEDQQRDGDRPPQRDREEAVERDRPDGRDRGRRGDPSEARRPEFRPRFRGRIEEDEEESGLGEFLELLRHSTDGLEIEVHISSRPPHPEPHWHGHEHDGRMAEMHERIEHIRIAAEHLHQAGMHELAEEVERQAHSREREIREHRLRRQEGPHEGVMDQLNELRREVERLRDDVNELRKGR